MDRQIGIGQVCRFFVAVNAASLLSWKDSERKLLGDEVFLFEHEKRKEEAGSSREEEGSRSARF